MFLDQEREEYEAIQREEALKRIQSLMKRYGITAADLVSVNGGVKVGHWAAQNQAG